MVSKTKNKKFSGVFGRNNLPGRHQGKHECAIINLDNFNGFGTHLVCYSEKIYFDPFGLPTPEEIINNISCLNIIIYNIKTKQVLNVVTTVYSS